MAQIIKRPFKSFNGADWDTHHFETEASLVKTSDNSDVESILNKIVTTITQENEYLTHKSKGGLIIQASWNTIAAPQYFRRIYFETAFPNKCIAVIPCSSYSLGGYNSWDSIYTSNVTKNQFDIAAADQGMRQGSIGVYWIAIGY